MVVKGIITSIDILTNNCVVELPIFKTVGSDDISAKAIFAIPPGVYNGYEVGDVVIVDFENNKMSKPVIIGKLYTGTQKETDSKGALLCNSLSVSNSAVLPGNTQLIFKDNLLNTYKNYTSITSIIDKLENTNLEISKLSANPYNGKEQVVGTWIDGKSIFRKTFVKLVNISANELWGTDGTSCVINFTDISTAIDNIWFDISHTMTVGDRYTLNPYNSNNNDYFTPYIDRTNAKVVLRGKAADNITQVIVTVEYTKV